METKKGKRLGKVIFGSIIFIYFTSNWLICMIVRASKWIEMGDYTVVQSCELIGINQDLWVSFKYIFFV